jgi:hypothetical protein
MFCCWLQWCGQVNFRSLLAKFGLTPKSKRGLAAGDSGVTVDPLDSL